MSGTFSPQAGDLIAGRYELKALLRDAGAVRSFSARDRPTSEDLTITLFDPECVLPNAWAAFARLVTAAAEVPGLVLPRQLARTPPDPPLCVCASSVARSFEQLCAEDGPLPWQRALMLGERLIELLLRAYTATQTAHRHLTPSRCLVDAQDRVQVLDFGIAEFVVESAHRSAYRAPGSPPARDDPRGDMYAVAAILFELMTGSCHSPGTPAHLRPGVIVPFAVDVFVAKALAVESERRYPDLATMRAVMRELLGLPEAPPIELPPAAHRPPGGAAPAPHEQQCRPAPHTAKDVRRVDPAPSQAGTTGTRSAAPTPLRSIPEEDTTLVLPATAPPLRSIPQEDTTLVLPATAPPQRSMPQDEITLTLPDAAAPPGKVSPASTTRASPVPGLLRAPSPHLDPPASATVPIQQSPRPAVAASPSAADLERTEVVPRGGPLVVNERTEVLSRATPTPPAASPSPVPEETTAVFPRRVPLRPPDDRTEVVPPSLATKVADDVTLIRLPVELPHPERPHPERLLPPGPPSRAEPPPVSRPAKPDDLIPSPSRAEPTLISRPAKPGDNLRPRASPTPRGSAPIAVLVVVSVLLAVLLLVLVVRAM